MGIYIKFLDAACLPKPGIGNSVAIDEGSA